MNPKRQAITDPILYYVFAEEMYSIRSSEYWTWRKRENVDVRQQT
jgi:hypothetical protein